MSSETSGTPTVRVLGKITEILECFSIEEPVLLMREIVRRTGLPPSTAQRLVYNLVQNGFLDREGDAFRIGIGLLRLASAGASGLDVVRRVEPFLHELRDESGETACLFLRDKGVRTIVALAQTRHVVMRYLAVGMVMPLHAGSSGRVFLAYDPRARADMLAAGLHKHTERTPTSIEFLDQEAARTRELGYAAGASEFNQGVTSISAPVFDHNRELAAVLSLGAPEVRVGEADFPRLAPIVMKAAARASVALGYPAR